jgi:hypothetical protein
VALARTSIGPLPAGTARRELHAGDWIGRAVDGQHDVSDEHAVLGAQRAGDLARGQAEAVGRERVRPRRCRARRHRAGDVEDVESLLGDPATLASVLAMLSLATLVACAVPAWRAARVAPEAALRED